MCFFRKKLAYEREQIRYTKTNQKLFRKAKKAKTEEQYSKYMNKISVNKARHLDIVSEIKQSNNC